MAPNPAIIKTVEQFNYRVTVGDVAAQAGLNVNQAQQGLLALASDAGGHLQVAESGDITYLFPKNFRTILRNKFLRLRLKEWWDKVGNVLFYLIRISFGIVLIFSIVLITITIAVILIAVQSSSDEDSGGGDMRPGGGGSFFFPAFFWFGPNPFWFFDPGYEQERRSRRQRERIRGSQRQSEMNFLEAVFSFLFGDGNPNSDLEERRWQQIGAVIRNHDGAVVAEQVAPYLDNIEAGESEYEDYMLPVLTRFNGYPEVSENGEIIYYFPDLQVSATRQRRQSVPAYLKEHPWRFSEAGSRQIMFATGLGGLNLILVLVLGSLLQGGELAAQIGGLVAFVQSIYWLLAGYATAFLVIPLLRYFWIQRKNRQVEVNNQRRAERAERLNRAGENLREKIAYAHQFAAQKVLSDEEVAYSTETDLTEQESDRADKIDEEWRRRLESGS